MSAPVDERVDLGPLKVAVDFVADAATDRPMDLDVAQLDLGVDVIIARRPAILVENIAAQLFREHIVLLLVMRIAVTREQLRLESVQKVVVG